MVGCADSRAHTKDPLDSRSVVCSSLTQTIYVGAGGALLLSLHGEGVFEALDSCFQVLDTGLATLPARARLSGWDREPASWADPARDAARGSVRLQGEGQPSLMPVASAGVRSGHAATLRVASPDR